MEFFIPCWIALTTLMGDAPSKSYIQKASKSIATRIEICNRVATEASKLDVDPILAISVAFTESRFSTHSSPKGAKGPLGVMPQYHCPKNGKCDYTQAGVRALKKYLELNNFEVCSALAKYNRGEDGKCEEGRSEYIYAQIVLTIVDRICASTDYCLSC